MGKKINLAEVIPLFFIYGFIALTIHEYGHLISMKFLGVSGYISSNYVDRVFFEVFPQDPNVRFIIGFAGGLAVIIIFGVLYLLDSDLENRFLYFAFIGSNLIYGVCEALAVRDLRPELMTWGSNLGMVFIIIYIIINAVSGKLDVFIGNKDQSSDEATQG